MTTILTSGKSGTKITLEPCFMEETFTQLIDHSLTYNTALRQGYFWVMDVIRDRKEGIVEPDYILSLVKKEKYKLGLSWAGRMILLFAGYIGMLEIMKQEN